VLTVVKVGGGLARAAGDGALRALCNTLGRLGERHALLVVPGGAGFADAVRESDRRFGLSAATSHRMAILGMEQFGWLLGELIPRAVRCADLARARTLAGGRTAVLLPAGIPLDALPASWQVTADSVAASVADQVGAGRLVLVKDAEGLYADWPARGEPIARLSVAELAALRAAGRAAGVDQHLPAVLAGAHFETWVVGGRDPSRVAELLERGTTAGTRIAAARLLRCGHG
jgi:5-(aminomethyl)-3-furanmethanol phosphate kinase